MRVIILGGGIAGTAMAHEIRKRSHDAIITILESTNHTQYSPCSLPYVLCGEIKGFEKIFVMYNEDYAREGINLYKNCTVTRIFPETNFIKYTSNAEENSLEYDYLVYALGSKSRFPDFEFIGNVDYHYLRTIDDAMKLKTALQEEKKLLVIGGGLIGVEAAYVGVANNMNVTLVEHSPHILNNALDADMAFYVEEYFREKGISVLKNTSINKIDCEICYTSSGEIEYDVLVFATGLIPNVQLAKENGIEVEHGIKVKRNFQTNYSNIYAIGDCAQIEKYNDDAGCVMLGSIAHSSARIVAENIFGNPIENEPVLGAAIAKLGEHIFGSTGITLERAKKKGIIAYGQIIEGSTRSGYHPLSKRILVKLVADKDHKILGAQIIGGEDVSGRINLCSLAIKEKMTLDRLAYFENVYNPGSAPINEPVSTCARVLMKKINHLAHKE